MAARSRIVIRFYLASRRIRSYLLAHIFRKLTTRSYVALFKTCKWAKNALLECKHRLNQFPVRNEIKIICEYDGWDIYIRRKRFVFEGGTHQHFDQFCENYSGFKFALINVKHRENEANEAEDFHYELLSKIAIILRKNKIGCLNYKTYSHLPVQEVFTYLRPDTFTAESNLPDYWKYVQRIENIKTANLLLTDSQVQESIFDGRFEKIDTLKVTFSLQSDAPVAYFYEFMKTRQDKNLRRMWIFFKSVQSNFLNSFRQDPGLFEENLSINQAFSPQIRRKYTYTGRNGDTAALIHFQPTSITLGPATIDCIFFGNQPHFFD